MQNLFPKGLLHALICPTAFLLYLTYCHDCVLRGSARGPAEVRRIQQAFATALLDGIDQTDPEIRDEALGVLLSLPEGHKTVLKIFPVYATKARQAWRDLAALVAEARALPAPDERTAGQRARPEEIGREMEARRWPIRAEYQVLMALARKSEANPDVIDGLADSAADTLLEMLPVCPAADEPILLRAIGRFGPRARRLLPRLAEWHNGRGIPGAAEAIARVGAE